MQVQTLPAQTFLSVHAVTTFKDIQDAVGRLVPQLQEAVDKGNARLAGPMTFVYHGATPEPDHPFELEVGFPVAEGTRPAGKAGVRTLDALEAGTVTYTGPLDAIDKAYDRLIPAMDAAGLSPGDEAREVYLNWVGPDAADNQILVAVSVRGGRR